MIECPQCEKQLRVPDSKRGVVVRCPACKEKFRVPEIEEEPRQHRSQPRGSRRSRTRDEGTPTRRRQTKSGTTDQFNTKAFVKRLLPIHAIVLGLGVLLIIGGFFSEYSALGAAGLLVVACLACIFTGRVWMAMDLGKESAGLGIAALLIPAVGVVYSFKNRGPSMRGAITLISCLIPTLFLGLAVLLFAPGGNGRAMFGPRARSKATSPETWANMIEKDEQNLTDDSPVVTVSLKITPRGPQTIEDLAARGDSLLSRFPSYVSGSFNVDVGTRTGTLQYRGHENRRSAYAHFVGLSTNTFVRAE